VALGESRFDGHFKNGTNDLEGDVPSVGFQGSFKAIKTFTSFKQFDHSVPMV
jgi:hypothetical protein